MVSLIDQQSGRLPGFLRDAPTLGRVRCATTGQEGDAQKNTEETVHGDDYDMMVCMNDLPSADLLSFVSGHSDREQVGYHYV